MKELLLEQRLEINDFIDRIALVTGHRTSPTGPIGQIITNLVIARDENHDKINELIEVLKMGPKSEHINLGLDFGKRCLCSQCEFVRAKNRVLGIK